MAQAQTVAGQPLPAERGGTRQDWIAIGAMLAIFLVARSSSTPCS